MNLVNLLRDFWHDTSGKGGGGKTSTVTETSSSEPWGEQKPYLTRGFKEALQQYESDKPKYFPGSTVVPFSPESKEALGIATDVARDPGSLVGRAETELGRTLSGEYLRPDNPLYQDMLRSTQALYQPGIDTGFAARGRFGSPLHAEALGRGISTGMAPFLESERGRQYGAIEQAPDVALAGANILSDVGVSREAKSFEELQEEIDRFNFGETIDAAKLAEYMSLISPAYGGAQTRTTSQPVYRDPLMQGLGVASSLAGIGSAAFGAPGGGGFLAK